MKFFGRRKFENDMDAELRFHIEAYTEDLASSIAHGFRFRLAPSRIGGNSDSNQ